MSELSEQWKPILGYEGLYEASSFGRIRSVDRLVVDTRNERVFKGKIRVQQLSNAGYMFVGLSKNGKVKRLLVHRLVLSAFKGCPDEGHVGCHNNGNRTDNRIGNLRWDTRSNNDLDKIKHGTHRANWTHCMRGHAFTPDNTKLRSNGYRTCRTCTREKNNAWYHRQKSA